MEQASLFLTLQPFIMYILTSAVETTLGFITVEKRVRNQDIVALLCKITE